jgi:hypothetical protein
MKNSMRAGALVAGLALGVSLAVPLALPAGAALKPTVSCAKLTAPPLKGKQITSTISMCKPAALAAGGGSVVTVKPNQKKGTVTETITWKNGKGKTVLTISYAPVTIGKCKKPYDSRVKITGKVSSSTGAAKIIKAGEPVTGFVCSITKGTKTGQSTIEPGTTLKL